MKDESDNDIVSINFLPVSSDENGFYEYSVWVSSDENENILIEAKGYRE